ncbi:MAG: hypothetical protein AB8B99_03820 [Phormidesmis sp.]
MTIELIDKTVNAVLVGLVYGGEVWLAGAFIFHVAKRWRQAAENRQDPQITFQKDTTVESLQNKRSNQGFIEVTILGSSDENATPQDIKPQEIKPQDINPQSINPQKISVQPIPTVKPVSTVHAAYSLSLSANISPEKKALKTESSPNKTPNKTSRKTPHKTAHQIPSKDIANPTASISQKPPALINSEQKQPVFSQLSEQPSGQPSDQLSAKRLPLEVKPSPTQTLVCEPVNWKLWKVADLRKASVAKACGVRTRPIGSRRNLLKADLIAQYKQNLKRLTKPAPMKHAERDNQEKIA